MDNHWETMANTCIKTFGLYLLVFASPRLWGVIITDRSSLVGAKSFKFLPYQIVGSVLDYQVDHG